MKIERKYMAHYLNTVFAGDAGTAAYVRLGKDLEEYSLHIFLQHHFQNNLRHTDIQVLTFLYQL